MEKNAIPNHVRNTHGNETTDYNFAVLLTNTWPLLPNINHVILVFNHAILVFNHVILVFNHEILVKIPLSSQVLAVSETHCLTRSH